MAAVDNVDEYPFAGIGKQKVRVQLTGASSTFATKFAYTRGFVFSVEGTNSTTCTRSGSTITITGTDDDWVNFDIWGDE